MEDFSAITDIKLVELKDIDTQLPQMEHYMDCAIRQKHYQLLKKEMPRLANRWEASSFANIRRPEPIIGNLIFLLENTCAVVNWLKNNLTKILKSATVN